MKRIRPAWTRKLSLSCHRERASVRRGLRRRQCAAHAAPAAPHTLSNATRRIPGVTVCVFSVLGGAAATAGAHATLQSLAGSVSQPDHSVSASRGRGKTSNASLETSSVSNEYSYIQAVCANYAPSDASLSLFLSPSLSLSPYSFFSGQFPAHV
jgi:tRNA(Met) C34 N-acetyltransferase TmcA